MNIRTWLLRCKHRNTEGDYIMYLDTDGRELRAGKRVCSDCGVTIIDYGKHGHKVRV